MAENETVQHREGEVLSTTVGDDGVVREVRWENGEERTHAFDHEEVRRPGPPPEVAEDGSPIPTLIYESHAANDGSARTIETFRDEDGDLRTRTTDYEPVFRPAPPEPTLVEVTPVAELDAWVHQSAIEAYPVDASHSVEIVAAPEPTLIQSTGVGEDGLVTTTYRDEYGDLRTIKYDTEQVRYPEPPMPTVVEYDVTANSESHGATHGADIEASAAHEADATHHDSNADASSPYSDHSAPAATHEAEHSTMSSEDGV